MGKTSARSVKGQVHVCSACGSRKHRVSTCPTRAGARIRQLLASLALKKAGKRSFQKKPSRMTPKMGKKNLAKRSKMYTVMKTFEKRKRARRQSAWGEHGRRSAIAPLFDSQVALARLQSSSWADPKPKACPECGCKGLSGPAPRADKSPGMLYYTCNTSYGGSCKRRFNCLRFSRFPKTKLTPGQLNDIIYKYCDTDAIKAPSIDDLAGGCGGGTVQVATVVEQLRKAEVRLAIKANSSGRLCGDVEIDEHGIRRFYVSRNNPVYKHLEPKLKKGQKHPPYWCAYIRVIGARRRGGQKTYLKFLPLRLLHPRAKPPPLTKDELINSRILQKIMKGAVVFTDGAKAYGSVLKANFRGKLISREVSHKNMQFSKKVRVPRGHSSLAGTQSIDSIWGRLQKGIPDTVHSKKGHSENPLITEYTWSSLFRLNNAHTDAACTLGAEALAAKKSSR